MLARNGKPIANKFNGETPIEFTESPSLSTISNKEKSSTVFGKISKAIREFINHNNDTTRHITSVERNTWNAKAAGNHTHTAVDVGALTNIKIGTVTTGAAGSNASASTTTSGTTTTLNLTIPKGDTGTQGPQGIQGPKGETGATGARGATGAQGPKGEKGDTGPQGPAGPGLLSPLGYVVAGNTKNVTINDRGTCEGYDCIASGSCSHAEGGTTTAAGGCSHSEGMETQALLRYGHSEGYKTTATYISDGTEGGAHAEGWITTAKGIGAHSEGSNTNATAHYTHSEGHRTDATGSAAHSEGASTEASGAYSHSEGNSTNATGLASHSEGSNTNATGQSSHSEGSGTEASGAYSHSEGSGTTASGVSSHAGGTGTRALGDHQTVIGTYNVSLRKSGSSTTASPLPDYSIALSTANALFIVGNGTHSTHSNAFRVDSDGQAYSNGSFNSAGADYAEYFEWDDGNPTNEDRRGLFVTLDGAKLKVANQNDDFILGVVSGNPSIVGDSYADQWNGMYMRDIFGSPIYEEVEVPDVIDDGKVIIKAHVELQMKLNPSYDNTKKYVPRNYRSEWSIVGMIGKLVVIDDGSCEVNEFCKPGRNGVATYSKEKTKFRVMERLDETHIRILIL